MSLTSIAVIAGGRLVFSLVSGRLRGTLITPPLIFVLFGLAIGYAGARLLDVAIERGW